MTRVWLIRHGEPESSVRGRCYGSLDIGLSVEGKRQMVLAQVTTEWATTEKESA